MGTGRSAARGAVGALLAALVSGTAVAAQQAPTQLTLEDAVSLAKGYSPTFLSTQNDQASANWQVREAYGQFLPSVDASLQGVWQEAGAQRFGTIVFDDQITDWYFSGYAIGLGVTIDGSTIFGVPNARANRRATEASISAAEFTLESTVAFQYMAVLRGQDGVAVAERQRARAPEPPDRADARRDGRSGRHRRTAGRSRSGPGRRGAHPGVA